MRIRLPLALALAILTLAPASLGGAAPAASPSAGASSVGPGFLNYAAPAGFPSVDGAGEPSIGVSWPTGSVFFQAYTQTYRARFDDTASPPTVDWANVGSGIQTLINVDPILFTDSTTGRTFAGGLDGFCSILGVSDDDGATWTPVNNACTAPAFDHETIGGGAWHEPRPAGAMADRAVYYCSQNRVQQCATSLDGGFTYLPAVPLGTACTGFVGHVKVAADGTAYVPARSCGSTQGVYVSANNGVTWTFRAITGSTIAPNGFDPSVAVSENGWLYAGWVDKAGHQKAAVSKNQGATWSTPVDVGALAGVTNATFSSVVAGDDQRAAVAFLGTSGAGNPFNAAYQGLWHLYVSLTYDGGATWQTLQVSEDPVQRGWICTSGTTCSAGRNLLDFIDATVDEDGRVLVAYADGCVGDCAGASGTPAMSSHAWATIARLTCGPSMFSDRTLNGGDVCPDMDAVPPTPLSGTFYATGLTPVGTADGVAAVLLPAAGVSLTPTPPAGVAPKVAGNGAGQSGSNAGTIYDAHWFLPAAAGGYKLEGQDVTVRLWVTGGGVGTMRVALYDAGASTFATGPGVVEATVPVPAAPVPTEVVVTFPDVTALFSTGVELFVDGPDAGDVSVLYDAASTPTSVTFA